MYLVIDDSDPEIPLASRRAYSRHRTHEAAEQAIRAEDTACREQQSDYRIGWSRQIWMERDGRLVKVGRLDEGADA